jgi:hypothetical protein
MKKESLFYPYNSIEFCEDWIVISDGEEVELSKNQVRELLPALTKWADEDSEISGKYYLEEK